MERVVTGRAGTKVLLEGGGSLRVELEAFRDFILECQPNGKKLHYRGDLDLVLREGREFQSVPWKTWRGRGYRRGKQGNCFMNAYDISWRNDLTYCEGFATTGVLPVHHAWAVTEDGLVVDPTWRDDDSRRPVEEWEYLGVPLADDFVLEVLARKKTYGVLDDFEIYNQPLPEGAVRKLTGSGILAATSERGMTMRVLMIPAEGPARVEEIENGLDAYQAAVGGWIETVPLKGDLQGNMILNEEGKIQDPPLPPNDRATEIANIFPGDYIAGDAVVVGPTDLEGNFRPVRREVIEFVARGGEVTGAEEDVA